MEREELEAFISFFTENIDLIGSNMWTKVYDKLIIQERNLIDTGVVTDFGFVGVFTKEVLDFGVNPLEHMDDIPSYFMEFVQTIKETPTIPSCITSIGRFSFAYCDNLEKAYIPKTMKIVYPYAFYGDKKLKDIYYEGSLLDLNNVDFGKHWCKGPPKVTIHCDDGDMVGVMQGNEKYKWEVE